MADIPVVARATLPPRDLVVMLAGAALPILFVAPYIGRRSRELITLAGASYADATGNLRVVVSRPAVFLEAAGADKDPVRTPRPLRSLRGGTAGRVVRALVEFAPPLRVRALAATADVSLATVSRVVSYLEHEALLTRDDKKRIVALDWPALLARWARDYDIRKSNTLRPMLEPRGLSALWPKLERLRRYAITGTPAGAGVAPPRIAMIYVDDIDEAAHTLDLAATDAGANVWLLQPFDAVVFERTQLRSIPTGAATTEPVIVAPAQAVVDLMSSPGRGPQEAEALIEMMKETVNEWRS